jgi:hypothetical protein
LKGEKFGVDNNYISIKPLVYSTKFIFEWCINPELIYHLIN